MTTLKIRAATRDDRDHLLRINTGLAEETEGKRLEVETVAAGVDAVFADPGKGFYLLCESGDDGVAGGLLVTSEWSDWRNAWYWWIQSVFVFPEFRKRGVYAALHRHVESLARARGDVCALRLYVDRENLSAKSTYSKLGMRPGRYDFYEQELR
jgi:GNAT superfamily N-acetyltransferase